MSDIRLEITALRWREQLLQKYSYTTRSPFDGCRNEMETGERRGGGRREEGVGGVCARGTQARAQSAKHTPSVSEQRQFQEQETVPGRTWAE